MQQLCLYFAQHVLTEDDSEASHLLDTGNHPDLMFVSRGLTATGKQRTQITIDQIRDLIQFAYLAPLRAHYRVGVISPACRMNANATNALLKLLEEPPTRMILILGCEQPKWLPATVRSRCQKLQVAPPRFDDAVQWVDEQGFANASELLELGNNAPLLACEYQDQLGSYRLLGNLCIGTQNLDGPLGELEQLTPTTWLAWAINWAAACAMLASKHQHDGIPEVAQQIYRQNKSSAIVWLNLYQQLIDLLPLAEHPINKRLLLEQVIWLFSKVTHP